MLQPSFVTVVRAPPSLQLTVILLLATAAPNSLPTLTSLSYFCASSRETKTCASPPPPPKHRCSDQAPFPCPPRSLLTEPVLQTAHPPPPFIHSLFASVFFSSLRRVSFTFSAFPSSLHFLCFLQRDFCVRVSVERSIGVQVKATRKNRAGATPSEFRGTEVRCAPALGNEEGKQAAAAGCMRLCALYAVSARPCVEFRGGSPGVFVRAHGREPRRLLWQDDACKRDGRRPVSFSSCPLLSCLPFASPPSFPLFLSLFLSFLIYLPRIRGLTSCCCSSRRPQVFLFFFFFFMG